MTADHRWSRAPSGTLRRRQRKAWLTTRTPGAAGRPAAPGRSTRRRSGAIYFTMRAGGAGLRHLCTEITSAAASISSVCRPAQARLDDGLLVAGRRLCGYWIEEVLAGVARKGKYKIEEEMKRRSALTAAAFTNQVLNRQRPESRANPQSARPAAEQVATLLGTRRVSIPARASSGKSWRRLPMKTILHRPVSQRPRQDHRSAGLTLVGTHRRRLAWIRPRHRPVSAFAGL